MNVTTRAMLTAAAGALALAGCSSSSDGDDDPASYADLLGAYEELGAEVDALDYSDPAGLPTSGGAEYDGVMRIATTGGGGAPAEMLGDLEVEVDFSAAAADPIGGTARDFRTPEGDLLDGRLVLDASVLDRAVDPNFNYTFTTELGGTLSQGDEDFAFDGIAFGDFYGEEHTHMAGVVDASYTHEGATYAAGGDFDAER